jgi:hypothetical protein
MKQALCRVRNSMHDSSGLQGSNSCTFHHAHKPICYSLMTCNLERK